jgi:predicted dehydrogenase
VTKTTAPIRLGLAGLGGYAGYICDRLLDEAKSDCPAAQFVAACDPALERFGARVRDLNSRGVATVRTFEQLLASDIEAVWLPLPIDLHRPYTEAALATGKAVMCEKPAAGCVDDVDAMIAARDRAAVPVLIGFQDMYQPAVATLKRRLASGEFGTPTSATVIGCWPRSERYFGRNDWAGRVKRDGRWVMDSPASNALTHFIHLSMFLLGSTTETCASATQVAAELYRANRIENFDTCSLRFTLERDIPLHIAYTHACSTNIDPIVTIETDTTLIRYVAGRHIEIQPLAGPVDGHREIIPLSAHPHAHMFRALQTCIRESTKDMLCASLEMAREHVAALNVVSEHTPIVDIPRDFIETLAGPDHAPLRAVRDLVPAMQHAIATRQLLHETALLPWSTRAVTRPVPRNYHHFTGPLPPRVSVTTHAPTPRRAVPSVTS